MSEIRPQTSNHRNPANAPSAADAPTRTHTSEESGMQMHQHDNQSTTALLRKETSVDTLETNSLCCAAAGVIAPSSNTTEALIPQEKLREAAPTNATLLAQNRPPAQPAVGYTHPDSNSESPSQMVVNKIQIDERTKFGRETPAPERLLCCAQHDIHRPYYENWDSLNSVAA